MTVFSVAVAGAATDSGLDVENVMSSIHLPEHPGLFCPLADHGFASGFHYAGANDAAFNFERGVHHAQGVYPEVFDVPFRRLLEYPAAFCLLRGVMSSVQTAAGKRKRRQQGKCIIRRCSPQISTAPSPSE